jgi:CubicO group peptidase (beta-lactamase class C family)
MNNLSLTRRLFCVASLALTLPYAAVAADIPAASPASKGMVGERLARIRPVIQAEIDAKRMPGAVVLIARKGAVVHAEAIGLQDPASGKALKRDSLFRAYSMTKPMVSVLAMMMVEEGQLQLADPVSKFLPALAKQTVLANPMDNSNATVPALRGKFEHALRRLSGAARERLLGLYDDPRAIDAMPVDAFIDLLVEAR